VSPDDRTFAEFYRVYRAHHRHPANRALHLLAKLLALASLAAAAGTRSWLLLAACPVLLVGPCWLGHLWFEGNRPVSWESPSESLLGTLAGWSGRLVRWRPAGRRPPGVRAALSAPGRACYSFLADLRMCGEMLSPRRAAGAERDASDPT
jgi:hypothetical protein